ncbi:CLUMA_CG020289, isoform A [Clunio marinus]|uniref:CLUMA_CG020289, isoform A n=1 Tax=Clunio marinus TaxID=568069 RepID=A0A1J1J764_9DIPT|nr:CLUMA_CG020289, isoform A [Clunio marinus]
MIELLLSLTLECRLSAVYVRCHSTLPKISTNALGHNAIMFLSNFQSSSSYELKLSRYFFMTLMVKNNRTDNVMIEVCEIIQTTCFEHLTFPVKKKLLPYVSQTLFSCLTRKLPLNVRLNSMIRAFLSLINESESHINMRGKEKCC